MISKVRAGTWLALCTISFAACDDEPTSLDEVGRFRVEVSGEDFVVQVETDAQVQELEARLQSGQRGVINGTIQSGDGGFNPPWGWHLVPSTVHTADFAIELCDGRPSLVQQDLTYWLETVKQYCPWGAKVVERIH